MLAEEDLIKRTTDLRNFINVAVVIPAFKAESTLTEVIFGLPDWIRHIIVIDDCSPDDSASIVMRIQENDPRIHIIRHPENLGVGAAVKSGYQEAKILKADVVVKLDSDGQMNPVYLPQLIRPILDNKADYTKGNRFLHDREIKTMPLGRRIGNLGLSFLTKLASGYWNIFDPTNGFTAISVDLISILDFSRIDNRFFFETSMLIELGLHKAVVKDISIPAFYGEEVSNLSNGKALFEFPMKLFRGLIRRIIITYYVRDFTAMTLFLTSGILLFTFGFIFGIYTWIRSASTGIVSTTGTVMISILPIILGIQLLLQAIVMDIQNVPSDVLHGQTNDNYDD